jgi:hypothetical protein
MGSVNAKMLTEDWKDQSIRFMVRRLERLQESRERGKDMMVDTDWLESLLIENLHLHERCNRLEKMLQNFSWTQQTISLNPLPTEMKVDRGSKSS